ncbi:MAG: Gfo/Idh/MocA family oxidoreductase, partial [Phycisphaerae bacterium]
SGRRFSRRSFVGGLGAGAAAFTIVPRHVLGGPGAKAPSDKINIAGIGVGGQGGGDIRAVGSENIVALCDVDDRRAGGTYKQFPNAKRYRDFRKMLDGMDKQIDAVVVGTPDHTHAVACLAALSRHKHVFCEKPLAHSIGEVRRVRKAARDAKVVTQLGNQGHSSGRIRSLCEWVWDGAIGKVAEVHAACDAFGGKYSAVGELDRLKEKHEVPKELDWDLWLGPAHKRPYNPMYVPTWWRAWLPFGTGRIGDWICHVVDPAFWALDLGAPSTIQAEVTGYDPKKHALVYPPGVKVTYEFAAKGKRGAVALYWYDGTWKMPHPKHLEEKRKVPGTGAVLVGEKGAIMHGSHGAGGARIIPDEAMRDYTQPKETIPRVKGHHWDFLDAIRNGRPAGSHFDYGGPLTELALLGVIAIKFPGLKLQWDAEKTQFPNCPEANQYIDPPYRDGWTL